MGDNLYRNQKVILQELTETPVRSVRFRTENVRYRTLWAYP